MKEIWLEICFNGEPVSNDIAKDIDDAKELIKYYQSEDFKESGHYEELIEWWIEEGFGQHPTVTANIKEDK